MTGKGEYYVRCKNCGGLIKVFKTPSQVYCTKCETLFDYDTQDIVFTGITTNPSDYHYECKEEKNIEEELTKYKKAFEILKDYFDFSFDDEHPDVLYHYFGDIVGCNPEDIELIKELINND